MYYECHHTHHPPPVTFNLTIISYVNRCLFFSGHLIHSNIHVLTLSDRVWDLDLPPYQTRLYENDKIY